MLVLIEEKTDTVNGQMKAKPQEALEYSLKTQWIHSL